MDTKKKKPSLYLATCLWELFWVPYQYFSLNFHITIWSNIISSEMPYLSNTWRYPLLSLSLNSCDFFIKLWYYLSIVVFSITIEAPWMLQHCSDPISRRKMSVLLSLYKYCMNEWKKKLLEKQEAFHEQRE